MTVDRFQKFCIRVLDTVDGTYILPQPVSYTGYLILDPPKKPRSGCIVNKQYLPQ